MASVQSEIALSQSPFAPTQGPGCCTPPHISDSAEWRPCSRRWPCHCRPAGSKQDLSVLIRRRILWIQPDSVGEFGDGLVVFVRVEVVHAPLAMGGGIRQFWFLVQTIENTPLLNPKKANQRTRFIVHLAVVRERKDVSRATRIPKTRVCEKGKKLVRVAGVTSVKIHRACIVGVPSDRGRCLENAEAGASGGRHTACACYFGQTAI